MIPNKSPLSIRAGMLAALSLACFGVANATSIAIINASFEDPVLNDGSFTTSGPGTGVLNGWNFAVQDGGSFEDFGIENPGSGAYTNASGTGTPSGADGTNVVFLNNNNSGLYTSMFQDVGLLQANTQYTLTVAIGQRLDRVNGSVQIGLFNGAASASDIWQTGTLLNSITGVSSLAGSFQDFTVSFTTGSSVSNDLYIGALYTADGTIQGSIDNFRLDATAVPEPSSFALLAGFGALMSVSFSRRNRRK